MVGSLRRNMFLIGGIALVAVLGLGTTLAMATKAGPFANTYEATGTIQSITGQSLDGKSGTIKFLPDGSTTAITVHYSSHTENKVHAGYYGTPGLLAGAQIKVHGTKNSDGSVDADELSDKSTSSTGTDDNHNNSQNGKGGKSTTSPPAHPTEQPTAHP